jgi:tRNA-splicing ligase RtcB (3'-phosphate/5'-hydroxy nucleic acid ligase)
LRSNLNLHDALPKFPKLADTLFRAIPAGVGEEGKIKLTSAQLDQVLEEGAHWAVRHGYRTAADLDYIEEHGHAMDAVPAHVSELAKKRQLAEMGTLGSGNHYLEVQAVDVFMTALPPWLLD